MATRFPAPRMIETNGITMAVHELGQGPAVVFCHGFPELAYSWRHQLPAVAAAGFRAIAPDQRGYGLSSAPREAEHYTMRHLTGDLAGMLDVLGIDRAVFCGHDWGGSVVWSMAQYHPDRVSGVIGVNTPFMPRAPMDPIQLMRMAFGEDMYIVFFQKPGVADALFDADPGKVLRLFFRKSSMTLAEFDARPPEQKNLAIRAALEADESLWPGTVLLDDEDMRVYTTAFTKSGFTGGINWYRNFTENWRASEQLPQKVTAPALMIMAENDVVLRPSMADGMEAYVPDLEKHLVRNCGHWTQQEYPEEVNAVITAWLKKRFG